MPTKRWEVVVRAQSPRIHPWETMLLSAGQFQVELWCVCVCVCVCVCECMLSRVQIFVTPWTVAQGFPLEWGAISFSRGFSNPGVGPVSPALTGGFFVTPPPGKWS